MTSRPVSQDGPASRPERPGRWRRAIDAVDERMGIKALAYPVPEHANNLGWSLGGLTTVAFLTLLVTGLYVTQFYSPVPVSANQSVRELVTHVWLGSFARALHYWAAQAMFALALLHLLRVFLHASYKKPREGNWVVGSAMFLLTFPAVFTGTVVPAPTAPSPASRRRPGAPCSRHLGRTRPTGRRPRLRRRASAV
ncbi:cytochrome b N-terminal domain-containing protein [Streptomyces sp. NPDC097981]|uniref:cytochrome b N-terminal domain-containing protein n=1 Tax=Streptomyces sp. NPDC097981 TaxID=3155428 RepID=UPI003324835D